MQGDYIVFLAISHNQHWAEPQDSTSICLTYKTKNLAQFNVKESNSEYSLEGLLLKLQYFSHLMWRYNSLEKTLRLGKTEGKRRKRLQRMRWLDSITNPIDMNLSNFRTKWRIREPGVLQSMGWQKVRHYLIIAQQQNLNIYGVPNIFRTLKVNFILYTTFAKWQFKWQWYSENFIIIPQKSEKE